MGTIVRFKGRSIVRCKYCNTIKEAGRDPLSHRGVDYRDGNRAHFWSVFASGWRTVEVIPVGSGKAALHDREFYYQCADCSTAQK